MMIGSIGSGGGMSFSSLQNLTSSTNDSKSSAGVGDIINSSSSNPSGSASPDSGSSAQISGGGSMLSDDTLNFLLTSIDGSNESSKDSSEKGSISQMLALANQAYGAATNLQSDAGSSVSGISGIQGVDGGSVGGLV